MRCRVPSRLYCISWLPGCRIRRSASGSAADFADFARRQPALQAFPRGMRSPLTCTSMHGAAPSCFASPAQADGNASNKARARAGRRPAFNGSLISNLLQQPTLCNEDVWRGQSTPASALALSQDDSAVTKLVAVLTRRARPVGRPTRRSWPLPPIRRDAFDDSCSVPSRPLSVAPASAGAGAGRDALPLFAQEAAPAPSVNINEYIVRGNTVLDPRQIERAVFLGPGRTLADVEKARDAVHALYQQAGYQSNSSSRSVAAWCC